MTIMVPLAVVMADDGAPIGMRKFGLLIVVVSALILVIWRVLDKALSARRPAPPERTFPILGKPTGPPQRRRRSRRGDSAR